MGMLRLAVGGLSVALLGLGGACVSSSSTPPKAVADASTPGFDSGQEADAQPPPDSGDTPDSAAPDSGADANVEVCVAITAAGDGGPTVCSIDGDAGATITFVNHCTARTVSTYWVDYSCGEQFYADLAPDASMDQPTFFTHPWRLRDKTTHELLKEVPPVAAATETVTVP
jgi:VHL beta domain